MAAKEGRVMLAPVVLSPVLIVTGIGLLLFPIDPRRLLKGQGVSDAEALRDLAVIWRVFLITGLILGAANCLAMKFLP